MESYVFSLNGTDDADFHSMSMCVMGTVVHNMVQVFDSFHLCWNPPGATSTNMVLL